MAYDREADLLSRHSNIDKAQASQQADFPLSPSDEWIRTRMLTEIEDAARNLEHLADELRRLEPFELPHERTLRDPYGQYAGTVNSTLVQGFNNTMMRVRNVAASASLIDQALNSPADYNAVKGALVGLQYRTEQLLAHMSSKKVKADALDALARTRRVLNGEGEA
jgi:hypothetical protein